MRQLAWLAMALVACTNTVPLFGPPTQSVCPAGSTLTYQGFGQPFMESYCTRCHASDLHGADRQGAPSFHDFDTLYGIKAVFDHVDETTAAGPAATNTSMPPDRPAPTLDERKQLGEWIACGMPGP
jgi:cytochrome c5